MYRSIKTAAALFIAATFMLAGCASSQKQNVYQTGQIQQTMRTKVATIVEVREVEIEVRPTGVGSTAGAAAGAVATTGTGRGGVVEGIAGMVIGGVAGAVAEKALSGKTGIEITYKIDGANDLEALVQEKDDQNLKPGDRIKLIQGAFSSRAVRLAAGIVR